MICLTFDTDHVSDRDMEEFLRRYPLPGRATFFCHRPYACLQGTGHELAPHPLIEDLRSWSADLERLAAQLPERPIGVRPHSCVYSHMVGIELARLGYRYVSQASNLYQSGLRPSRHPWGIWELPIYYMDNMDFWMCRNWPGLGHKPFDRGVIERALSEPDSLFVFDLHPLHIALNTRGHEDYATSKSRVVEGGESAFAHAREGRGTRMFFEELCNAMESANVRSSSCAEALEAFGCTIQ